MVLALADCGRLRQNKAPRTEQLITHKYTLEHTLKDKRLSAPAAVAFEQTNRSKNLDREREKPLDGRQHTTTTTTEQFDKANDFRTLIKIVCTAQQADDVCTANWR